MQTPTVPMSPWPYVVAFCAAMACGLGAFAMLVFAPSAATDHALAKIGTGIRAVAADPAGAITAGLGLVSVAVGLYTGARALFLHTPTPVVIADRRAASREDGSASARVLAWVALASVMLLASAALLLPGCGGLSATQRTTLATETQRCLIAEREIVDRQGTSAEQDRADLAAERERCDAARAAIVGGGQ